jgi:hypothetical protein
VAAAVAAGDFRLGLTADDADDGRPERARPLAKDQSGAAGGGVYQDRIAAATR